MKQQTAVEWLIEQSSKHCFNNKDINQAKEMEKQDSNQEDIFEREKYRAVEFAKWFSDFNGLTFAEKRVSREHLNNLYEKYLSTLGGIVKNNQ